MEGVPISDLCDELGLQPTVFCRWQKEFFENGAAAFERRRLLAGASAGDSGQGIGNWKRRGNSGRIAASKGVTYETDYFRFADNPPGISSTNLTGRL